MVESWKSFIQNIQNQGRWWIYNNMKTKAQEVRQQRADQLENSTTINQLWDTDSQATIKTPILNKEQIAKDAEAIVNSKIGQKLIWFANTIWWKPEEWNLGAFSETFERWKERAEANLEEKKKFLEEDVYEDTAKIEKVAWVNEQGEQYIKSKAREEYEAFQKLWEARWLWWKKVKDMFPQYWQTTDGQREYRTDWQYVVNRPVWYTPDLLETMQDAYNSVTYAYAQDGVVLTPDDLKKAYPEYANVSDWTLANFISWCMFDVQNWKKSDIKTVWDAMWEMALTEWYTNRMDGYLDILSDESIINHGFDKKMAKNKEWEQDMILAWEYLKRIVNEIRATWSFSEWLSDWAILSSYRKLKSDDPEVQEEINMIDKYMTLLEQKESIDWVQVLVANLYNNYKGEMKWAKTDVESDNFVAIDTFREVLKEQSSRLISDMKNVMQEMRDQSEQEWWYPMKNAFENILLWKYYRDNEWNYYQENMFWKGQLAFSKRDDWTYMDAEWNIYSADEMWEINKQWFIGRMSTWVVGALASIATSTIEWTMDINRLIESWDSQYAHAVAADIIQGYFWVIMANPQVQYMFAIPGIWDVASNILWFGIDNIWAMYLWLLEEFWITDWWTLESKDKVQEWAWALWMIFASKSVKWLKNKIKANPKLRAIDFALRSYLGKLSKIAKIKNKKGLERLIEEWNKAIEQERLEREQKRLAQQQTADTTLAQDVRAWEKSNKIIEKETEKKKETAKSELDSKKAIPLFKLLSSELAKAKEEFFDEFYEEYKKQAGWEANMDSAVLLERDLRDMADPVKKQQLIDKYREIFGEEILERNAKEWENFWREIMELKQEVMDSMKVEQEAAEIKDTKEVLEEEALPWKKPTKKYEKIEKKYLDLPWDTKRELTQNPFRYILKDILKDFIEPLNKKGEVVDWGSKDIVRYKRKVKNIDRVFVQEKIMDKRKEMAQNYMNKLQENQKKLFKFKEEFFDKTIDYDIKDFFLNFLRDTKVDNKLSRLFKDWTLSLERVYDEKWNISLEVVYNWEQRMPSTEVRETMELLNDIFKELERYWKDDKLLLDEASLYELRKLMKEWWYTIKWKEKAWTSADRAQDLYTIFNDYLDTYKDTTWIWKDIRPYDHAFGDYFDLVEMLEPFFNKKWEIKKESRNRLIDIWKLLWTRIDMLESIIPWTKAYLRLMETWHDFITSMVTLMEATEYKTWFWKRVLKYAPMVLTMEALGSVWWFAGRALWVPLWETVWETVRNTIWRKRPLTKEINEIFKQLDLTEEEIKLLKEKRPSRFEKVLNNLDTYFDKALEEIVWDYEKWRQVEQWPKAYDRRGNEVKRVNEDWTVIEVEPKWWPSDTTPPTSPTSKWPNNSPKNDWGKGMEKEISDIEDSWIMEEFETIDSVSNQLESIVRDMVVNAKTTKEAKLIVAAAWLKMTNEILALRDSPRVRAAKKEAQRIMQMDKWYELLQKKIEKSEWDVQMVYANALYKLMLAQKAPTSMISIDLSEVNKSKNIKESAAYSTEWEKLGEFEANKSKPKSYETYWKDYADTIESLAKECKWDINKLSDEMIDKSDIVQFMPEEGRNTSRIYEDVREDVRKAIFEEKEANRTSREQSKNIRIKEKEGERIEKEVWKMMSPEDIKKREDLWFSFDKFWSKATKTKNRTRIDNQWATITNKDKVDYIDWWLNRWTVMISWWEKDWMTTVMVNNLETLSNFPQVEKSLPKNSIILDASTWKEYSLADIQRMDIKWETNKKTFEEYYKKQMESYPEDVQGLFKEESKVVPEQKTKSEPQEIQTEQSSTEKENQSNLETKKTEKKTKKVSKEDIAHLFWEDKIPEKTNQWKWKENVEKFDETFKGDEMEENADWEVIWQSKEMKMREYVKDNFKSVKSNAEAVVEDRYNIQLIKTKLAHNTNIESKDLNVLFENKQIDADTLGQFNRWNVSIKLWNRWLKYTEAHEYWHYLDCKFSKELLWGEWGRWLSYMIEKWDISKLDSTKKQLINEFKTIKEQIDKQLSWEEITEEKFATFAEEFTKRVEGDKSKIFDEALFKEYTNWLSNMAEARAKWQLNNWTLKPSLEWMIWDMRQHRIHPTEDIPSDLKKEINNMIKERWLTPAKNTYLAKIQAINDSITKWLTSEDQKTPEDIAAYKIKDRYIDYQITLLDEIIQDRWRARSPEAIRWWTYVSFRSKWIVFSPHIEWELYDKLKSEWRLKKPEEYEKIREQKREEEENKKSN